MSASAARTGNRRLIALAGIIVMICLGIVYSWSLFTRALIASFGWSNQGATFPFELAIFFLGVDAVFGVAGKTELVHARSRSPVRCSGVSA